VSERPPGLRVDEMVQLLAGGAARPLHAGTSVSQLDHALQTAALLLRRHPGDLELAAAGLVHDIGHLLPGVDDEAHAGAGADAVRAALGHRVAGLVALHVEAKRYLVATEPGYGDALGTDSVASLATQGGSLSEDEVAAFEALPLAPEATSVRRADDSGKVEGLAVRDLRWWAPLLRGLSEPGGAARS
jgi:predicted HD phosphohydrolase